MKIHSAAVALFLLASPTFAQKAAKAKAADPAAPQKMDEEYTKLIKEYLNDSRVTTELVDHMPASDTVPSPLKFLGRIPGKPDELTYAKDIYRYYEALAKASHRARFWKLGTTEEGRDGGSGHRGRSYVERPRQVQGAIGGIERSAQDHRRAGSRNY